MRSRIKLSVLVDDAKTRAEPTIRVSTDVFRAMVEAVREAKRYRGGQYHSKKAAKLDDALEAFEL